MVILKSKEEELHWFFWLAQCHKPHPSQLTTALLGLVKFTVQRIEPCISPWNHNGCESLSLWEGWSLLIVRRYLFSAYPPLGAYLLTPYTYKHMRLLTRVYGMVFPCQKHPSIPHFRSRWRCSGNSSHYLVHPFFYWISGGSHAVYQQRLEIFQRPWKLPSIGIIHFNCHLHC